jgi:hypothetical protein
MPLPSQLTLGNNVDVSKNVILRNNDDGTLDIGYGGISSPNIVQRIGSSALVFKNSSTPVTLANANAIITVNGSFTLNHAVTASQAGPGFRYTIRNVGMGTITIDPVGSETIGSMTQYGQTLQCLAGQEFDVVCDGSNWFTVGRQGRVLITQQTVDISVPVAAVYFNLPPDYTSLEIDIPHFAQGNDGAMYVYFSVDSGGSYVGGIYTQMTYYSEAQFGNARIVNTNFCYVTVNGLINHGGNARIRLLGTYPYPGHQRFDIQSGCVNVDGTELMHFYNGRIVGLTPGQRINFVRLLFSASGAQFVGGNFNLYGVM